MEVGKLGGVHFIVTSKHGKQAAFMSREDLQSICKNMTRRAFHGSPIRYSGDALAFMCETLNVLPHSLPMPPHMKMISQGTAHIDLQNNRVIVGR